MLDVQRDVLAFHRRFKHPAPPSPTGPTPRLAMFRARLLREELVEVLEVLHHHDTYDGKTKALGKLAAELCDLIYVTVGTAVALGIDLQPHWDAIQAANLTKEPNGTDKPTKPAGWQAPDHTALLRAQQEDRE